MSAPAWPQPHPQLGEALTIRQVADLLGGIGANAIDVQLTRSRQGNVRVPFPEPAGTAVPTPLGGPKRNPRGYPCRFWWRVDIERYRAARVTAGGNRRTITDAQISEIRRLAVDGMGVQAIARRTGITTASVSRIVNNKAHVPKEQP